jgi:hypothetical protein
MAAMTAGPRMGGTPMMGGGPAPMTGGLAGPMRGPVGPRQGGYRADSALTGIGA